MLFKPRTTKNTELELEVKVAKVKAYGEKILEPNQGDASGCLLSAWRLHTRINSFSALRAALMNRTATALTSYVP